MTVTYVLEGGDPGRGRVGLNGWISETLWVLPTQDGRSSDVRRTRLLGPRTDPGVRFLSGLQVPPSVAHFFFPPPATFSLNIPCLRWAVPKGKGVSWGKVDFDQCDPGSSFPISPGLGSCRRRPPTSKTLFFTLSQVILPGVHSSWFL